MLSKQVFFDVPARSPSRLLAAAVLHACSKALGQLARRLLHVERTVRRADPVFEFYAESGAPEGALYVDGKLAGRLEGVSRL